MNYYNENDPKSAAWLRELMDAGEVPLGWVDERSIFEVKANELKKYVQCHFFAGIGGWPLALQLVGWPTKRPVWTGSCPCQPFSAAGRGLGEADERHLWPVFRNLIGECRPPTVFGEQVASPSALRWLDGVYSDMEAAGYAVGAADLCAASVGAPHPRQRIFWVADSDLPEHHKREAGGQQPIRDESEKVCRMDNAVRAGLQGRCDHRRRENPNKRSAWSTGVAIECTDGKLRRIESGSFPLAHGIPGRMGLLRGYSNAIVPQVAATFIAAWLSR